MSKVLCVGSTVVDFIFNFEELPVGGQKFVTQDAQIIGGGIAANAAVAIARLGGEAILSAQLGQDAMADLILQDLKNEGVNVSHVTQSPGARSSYSSVYIAADGERQIVNYRGSGLAIQTDWYAQIDGLKAVLVDTRVPDAAKRALKLASERGLPGIVDAEAPIDEELLHLASHVAFSEPGLLSLFPDLSLPEAVKCAAEKYDIWAAVTHGEHGVHIYASGAAAHVPAPSVTAIDTLAAGDVWHGAFALGLAQGKSEMEAVRRANAVAAIKCTRPGGRAGTPTAQELEDFLNRSV